MTGPAFVQPATQPARLSSPPRISRPSTETRAFSRRVTGFTSKRRVLAPSNAMHSADSPRVASGSHPSSRRVVSHAEGPRSVTDQRTETARRPTPNRPRLVVDSMPRTSLLEAEIKATGTSGLFHPRLPTVSSPTTPVAVATSPDALQPSSDHRCDARSNSNPARCTSTLSVQTSSGPRARSISRSSVVLDSRSSRSRRRSSTNAASSAMKAVSEPPTRPA